ncbi:hypothetical protein SEA_TELAVIV_76 [Mycobacterium phage TelAviv]|uniref:Uncharacterized protein n=1 Tax=Mycobacterium phage Catdawg TaxID=1340819 RepID=S5Y969_9CAUD|nr:hypothetical protein PBI_CATDAWG_79 [Mycobacterium phage Catdawg]ATW60562.1 hypothetical protein SEA_FAMILTON_80 [Mycobacterium phage Familton]AVI04110.1 hypothetical protein SEA_JANGDYNASTY_79 [Mycobacterium phage JangDynasty]QGJ87401.1 hypothetical protein SEA_BLESSICA_80 [Mycobacterium phage Blessica]QPO16564.1 hypothetical protein SEA_TELAVIV_76 [Mycobacterium phage TelAviv]URM87850.1 hypothetical protein SEA_IDERGOLLASPER_79 [Mycobacterium phage Idergollasper]
MSTLIADAQKYIEQVMADLTGDDDFPPFLALENSKGEVMIAMLRASSKGDEARDMMADMMAALCLAHRAVAVLFASVCWMVTCDSQEEAFNLAAAPSEHPDRKEAIVLTATRNLGNTTEAHIANVIRENNLVGVGLWEEMDGSEAAGRFVSAMKFGLRLAPRLPKVFCDVVDKALNSDNLEDTQRILTMMAETIGKIRRGEVGPGSPLMN